MPIFERCAATPRRVLSRKLLLLPIGLSALLVSLRGGEQGDSPCPTPPLPGALGFRSAAASLGQPGMDSEELGSLVKLARVNCSCLLQGELRCVTRARAFLSSSCRFAFDDSHLLRLTCPQLRARGYAYEPADDAESAFPIAYGLRMHTGAAQAELLLRAIYAPQNVYCVHVDAKAAAEVHAAVAHVASCFSNVWLAPPDDFVYGSVSPVKVDMRCMDILLRTPAKWSYFINVVGQELPLKTNGEIVRILKLYNGSNDIESAIDESSRYRQESKFWCSDAAGKQYRCWWKSRKSPPPPGVAVHKGSAYGFFSRAFVEYALSGSGRPSVLLDWLSDTYSPDEHFWASLNRLAEAPGGYRGPEPTLTHSRAVVWRGQRQCGGKFVRDVCVFGVADLPWLLGRHEAFANKFSVEFDPIAVHCLTESVRERAAAAAKHRAASGGAPPDQSYLSVYRELPQIRRPS